jgi:hypothetical protein
MLCAEASALHDLAALSEDNLSSDGSFRLVYHLARCADCQHVFVSLFGEPRREPRPCVAQVCG